MAREQTNDSRFAKPSQSDSFSLSLLSTQCCSKLCTIVCLGRLLQGGAPPLVFVQPVRELLRPSDLSLALSLEILSPFYPGYYFCGRCAHVKHDKRV